MLLHRKEITSLRDWAGQTERKPLIIRGARQVGKSTLVRQLAEEQGMPLLEINFERNPEFREAFKSNDPRQVVTALQLLSGRQVEPGKTLLFLDEIQAASEALPVLRYFYEELPELHVIAAGSLLEFALADAEFSMPVGRIEYMYLGPLQFSDFLRAMQQQELANYLDGFSLQDIQNNALLGAVHQKYLSWLKQFWITGGMPEAVASYAQTQSFSDVARIQQSIVATYRDDFNKYAGRKTNLVQLVFDQLPAMVGQKFKYANVSRDYRAAELGEALQQLCMARIAHKVFHTSANGVPLDAEVNARYFKPLYLDIGLQSAALKLNVLDLDKDDLSLVNKGALAEQFIGQHLLFSGEYYEVPTLYYWVREARSASAEIDYILSCGQQVVPVEIKAGKTGRLRSLHQFLKEKQGDFALRFNADVPSLLVDSQPLTTGGSLDYRLLSLPIYMVEQSLRIMRECL